MLIRIDRESVEPNSSHVFGVLSIDGKEAMFTMEPAPREDHVFIPGERALPPGFYNLSITPCARHHPFRRELPLLVQMPAANERRGIQYMLGMRIHPGLRVGDTVTEIAVGRRRVGGTIVETIEAFNILVRIIEEAIKREEAVEVEIRQGTA